MTVEQAHRAVSAPSSESEASGWRRHGLIAFIVVWLSVQIGFPLVQKVERSTFRYRYTRFSWAMFSRITPRYEVQLFRTRGDRGPEPIPEIGRYVRGYTSPGPMRMAATYVSEDEVHDRFFRLVSHLARHQHDGYTYIASIRWTGQQRLGVPTLMEFRAEAAE